VGGATAAGADWRVATSEGRLLLDVISLHDIVYTVASQVCTLTERGQVSMPAALRRQMHLKAGQRLRWEAVSDTELRIGWKRHSRIL